MDNPNLIESITPCSGAYSARKDLRLNAWLAVTAVVYCLALFLTHRHPAWPPLTRGIIGLVPLIPSSLYIRDWMRFVRGLDELQRRVQVEALLFAAFGTVLLGAALNVLLAAGVTVFGTLPHGLGLGGSYIALFTLWLVGGALAGARYK